MEKYLGVKMIEAEPMTECTFLSVFKGQDVSNREDRPGYLVKYQDGYESWSPKEVFEEAYRRIDGATFGLAIEAAKKGKKFKLPHWKEDVFISLQIPDENSKMTHPYLYVTSRFGCVPWIPTMVEMLAENYIIIDNS
jgi:hypothetical protein